MKNKKFMSRLFSAVLAGAMVLSMVPAAFAASAEEPAEQSIIPHYGSWESNGDGTHSRTCKHTFCIGHAHVQTDGCHYDDADVCTVCGYEKLATKPGNTPIDSNYGYGNECDHMGNHFKQVDNQDGETHDVVCTDCGETVSFDVAHYYTNGVCSCGAEEPSCDHMGNHWDYVDNEDGTHNVVCKDCETPVNTLDHTFTDGKCICGAVEPEEETCDHMGNNWAYVDNEDGTHNVVCKDCETPVNTLDHTFTDGKCICGAEEPAASSCDHVGKEFTYTNNGNGTHKVTCECNEVVTEEAVHVFTDGKCICGAVEPEEETCDHMGNNWSYVNNEDGTHDVVCADCEETVTADVAHYFINGKCICGAEEAVCDHMGNHWKYENKGETHDVICVDCGKTVTADMAHYFIDGKCICGAEKAEDAELKTVAINFYSEDDEKQIAEVNVEVAANATYINTSILTAPKGYEIAIVGDLPIRDGYVYVVVRKAQSTCDHMANDWSYVNNGDGTHNVVCNACEEVVTGSIAHYFIDGKCICGAEEVVCDHMGNHWTYTDNGNGTHKVVCADCGETVTEEAECNYESGECICGSKKADEKPAEKPEDKPSQDDTEEPTTKPSTSTSNKGTSVLGGLLESAGLFSFFRILFKALFHI